jgi:UDP-2,3-diacylglucosamine pyrophosphatase LpxH
MRIMLVLAVLAACGGPSRSSSGSGSNPRSDDALAARFPLAQLDDRALCDQLLARAEADYQVTVDPEPRTRRKLIVSDLHLGPGTRDARFAGLEDFYSDREWSAFLDAERAAGTVDLIIAGDFIEFWQIATVLGALPKLEDRVQPVGSVLGADQAFAVEAVQLVIAAHPEVFSALGRLLDGGDNRVIVVAGNHDADLLWPKVQLAIARAIGARDPSRLMFVSAAAYEHAGVHVAHGHAHDAANRFATGHAPFGRDRDGRCRLQTNWGEVFVDRFYTETERQIPFIDNLYPESAAILWALRDNPDAARDLGAAVRMFDLLRSAQGKRLNRDAVGAVLQNVFGGGGGGGRGPESTGDVVGHVSDRLTRGDNSAEGLVRALMRLNHDPELAKLRSGIVAAARALPDFPAALRILQGIDPAALSRLREELFGDPMETAAQQVLATRDVDVVVFGHTHLVAGIVKRLASRDHGGHYANTGSWIAVASVAELKARGIGWDRLSLADRATFPSKTTAVIVDYDDDGNPLAPAVHNAGDRDGFH